ncbi:hypothetical protein HNP40_000312 [Mycobacteroides chelonae]|nr:hypothetical protein [Mycobacteroides chelonae]
MGHDLIDQPIGEYPPLVPYGVINAVVAETFDALTSAFLPHGISAVPPVLKLSIRDNIGPI